MITTEPSHPTLFALGCHNAIFISVDFALRELVTPSSLRTLAPRRTRTRWMAAARNPGCWWAMSSFLTSFLFSFFIRTRGPLLNCPENCSGWFKIFFRESGGGEWNTNRDLRRPSQFQRLDSETGGGGRHNSILKVALQIFFLFKWYFWSFVGEYIHNQATLKRQTSCSFTTWLSRFFGQIPYIYSWKPNPNHQNAAGLCKSVPARPVERS